jgi:hypothetical protein
MSLVWGLREGGLCHGINAGCFDCVAVACYRSCCLLSGTNASTLQQFVRCYHSTLCATAAHNDRRRQHVCGTPHNYLHPRRPLTNLSRPNHHPNTTSQLPAPDTCAHAADHDTQHISTAQECTPDTICHLLHVLV